jgi:hypothetical protein
MAQQAASVFELDCAGTSAAGQHDQAEADQYQADAAGLNRVKYLGGVGARHVRSSSDEKWQGLQLFHDIFLAEFITAEKIAFFYDRRITPQYGTR